MSDSIVSLRHVEKWYGNNHVVKDKNLEIHEGEFLTLLGAVRLRKNHNAPAFNFDYKTNVFFQKDVGDALTIYDKYYQMLKVG